MPLPVLYRVRILSGMIALLAIIGVVGVASMVTHPERGRQDGLREHISSHFLPSGR